MVKCHFCNHTVKTLSKEETDEQFNKDGTFIGYICTYCAADYTPRAFSENEFSENDTHNYYESHSRK